MYCPKCGTEIKDDGTFCSKCGNDLKYPKVETERKEISGKIPNKMFQNPFSFEGRIRRSEYGISYIIYIFIAIIITIIAETGRDADFVYIAYIPVIFFLLAQGSKRCHDRGNSGWYQLIPFYALWLLFGDSEKGTNRFGLNPKGINQYSPNPKEIDTEQKSTKDNDNGTRLNIIQENIKTDEIKRLNKELIWVAVFGILIFLSGVVFLLQGNVYVGLGSIIYGIYKFTKRSESNSQTIIALNRTIPITLSVILLSIFALIHISNVIIYFTSSNLYYILSNLFLGLIALSAAKFLLKSEKAGGIIGITYAILELILIILLSTSNLQYTSIVETYMSILTVAIIVLFGLLCFGWKSLNERKVKETEITINRQM